MRKPCRQCSGEFELPGIGNHQYCSQRCRQEAVRLASKRYYEEIKDDPEFRRKRRDYYLRNREKILETSKWHYQEYKQASNYQLKKWLWSKYKMSLPDYEARVASQFGQCAVCGGRPTRFVVDHDHSTSEIRGLLCHMCNIMLGCAKDTPEVLRQAALYLERRPPQCVSH